MDLRHFQIFCTVCECGSFTSAADKLYMSQPAVSVAMKELEAFYDTQLFIRANRKIYLTDEGRLLFDQASDIMEIFRNTRLALKENQMVNKVSLGVNITTAETWLAHLVDDVIESKMDVELNYKIGNSDMLENLVLENQLDFAIIDLISMPKQLKLMKLYDDEMVVVCNPKYYADTSISLAALAKHPLYLQEKGTGSRRCVDSVFLANGYYPIVKAESTSSLSLIQLAKSGRGFAILSSETAETFSLDPELQTVEVPRVAFKRHYFLAYNKNRQLTSVQAELVDCMLNAK